MTMTEEEWRAARTGRVTASRVADVVRKTKSGVSASRARYMGELVAERLTGIPQDNGYSSPDMQRGADMEAEARAAYAFDRNVEITPGGMVFVPHPDISEAGASPDAWVEPDGLAEVKSPATHTHISYLTERKVPADYVTQMQFQMAVTGRAWCDFVSYDPRMPENLRLFVKRVERDDKRIAELESAVREFLTEVDATVERLRRLAA